MKTNIKKINKIVSSSAHSVEMEGFVVTKEQKEMCKKLLSKEITYDEYMYEVKKSIGAI